MKVGIYARLSRNRDGESTSIDRQVEACKGRLEAGWSVVETYTDDDISAYSGKRRPSYERLLADVRAGRVEVIVAFALDRLLRQPRDVEALLDSGVRFLTVRDGIDSRTPTGQLVARMMAAVAANESETIGARVRSKHGELRTKGAWSGGRVPFGWQSEEDENGHRHVTGKLDEEEAQGLREAAARIVAGESLTKVAGDLGQHPTRLKRALVSPLMIGRRKVGSGLSEKVGMPPILDESTWRAVSVVLTDPARRTSFGGTRKHFLAGLLTCGLCGRTLMTHTKRGAKKPSLQRRYQCLTSHRGCGRLSINAGPAEELVYREWVAFTASDVFRSWMEEAMSAGARADADREAVQKALESDRSALYGLMDRYTSGNLTEGEWERARAALIARIEGAEKVLAVDSVPFDAESKSWALSGDPELARGLWEAASVDERRQELKDAFERITIAPAKGRGRRFDASRVTLMPRTA